MISWQLQQPEIKQAAGSRMQQPAASRTKQAATEKINRRKQQENAECKRSSKLGISTYQEVRPQESMRQPGREEVTPACRLQVDSTLGPASRQPRACILK